MSEATVRVHRHEAMATTFELRLVCADARYAAQAAAECFLLLERLESLLNRHDEGSEVSRLSRLAPGDSMRLAKDTFECLRQAITLQVMTGGAFDPFVGREVDALKGRGSLESLPARRGLLHLAPDTHTAQILAEKVSIDLGAIGKGYALDRMAELLAEWDVTRALLIAGEGSSVLAMEGPRPHEAWPVGLAEGEARKIVQLERCALGASGLSVHGQHILDPLRNAPASGRRAWALAPNAAMADALSTAAMTLTSDELEELCMLEVDLGIAILDSVSNFTLQTFGLLNTPLPHPTTP